MVFGGVGKWLACLGCLFQRRRRFSSLGWMGEGCHPQRWGSWAQVSGIQPRGWLSYAVVCQVGCEYVLLGAVKDEAGERQCKGIGKATNLMIHGLAWTQPYQLKYWNASILGGKQSLLWAHHVYPAHGEELEGYHLAFWASSPRDNLWKQGPDELLGTSKLSPSFLMAAGITQTQSRHFLHRSDGPWCQNSWEDTLQNGNSAKNAYSQSIISWAGEKNQVIAAFTFYLDSLVWYIATSREEIWNFC